MTPSSRSGEIGASFSHLPEWPCSLGRVGCRRVPVGPAAQLRARVESRESQPGCRHEEPADRGRGIPQYSSERHRFPPARLGREAPTLPPSPTLLYPPPTGGPAGVAEL